MGPGIKGWKRE
jgi:hypothetical protein